MSGEPGTRPIVHLICNAHLDPVWQWRWEEGCAEAIATFSSAADLLESHPGLIFNHNESFLYRSVLEYRPDLFARIVRLVEQGRWCISGGWYLQPDVNMIGTESLIRHIIEGRQFFAKHFGVRPRVAYNFDSFGHTGGLPQILVRSGFGMYIHMRPQEREMNLPSDLYRWRGVDGTEIPAYRIAVGLYHTERDNIEERISNGVDLALTLNRDVPVFWGIGNHGGGPTRQDVRKIEEMIKREDRVDIVHSTTERLLEALRLPAHGAPVVEGDLQRVFTGCYTSLARVKRRNQASLGTLVQTEALRAATWWQFGHEYPSEEIDAVWRDHLLNDFHDILPGSCTEPAEQDALDLYGKVSESARRLRLGAAAVYNSGPPLPLYVPITVLTANPSCLSAPVEVEAMLDLRPKWSGTWHLRLSSLDGSEIPCQEEQPEALLPFNGWRRKLVFFTALPHVGAAHVTASIVEGEANRPTRPPLLRHAMNADIGLIDRLDAGGGANCLAGPLLEPILVRDPGDSWGTDIWEYGEIAGRFEHVRGSTGVIASGPIRTVTESSFVFDRSRIVMQAIGYVDWPVIEVRMRITWNQKEQMLKLVIPTVFRQSTPLCEVPGGAISRPPDGQEHVHTRWLVLRGTISGRDTALAVVNNGQHGFDCRDGEIRLSALRSAAYCHERGFRLGDQPEREHMDQGVHDARLLITAGDADHVLCAVSGLADWLSCPPAAYAHLPIGAESGRQSVPNDLLSIIPRQVRMLALKQSRDGTGLILRIQETAGMECEALVQVNTPFIRAGFRLTPYEIRTIRFERDGKWKTVDMIEEETGR